MYVDDAVKSPVDGVWVLPLGRRLETRDGRFAGAVAARGRVDYFEQFYRNVQLDAVTSIALMGQNGTPHRTPSARRRRSRPALPALRAAPAHQYRPGAGGEPGGRRRPLLRAQARPGLPARSDRHARGPGGARAMARAIHRHGLAHARAERARRRAPRPPHAPACAPAGKPGALRARRGGVGRRCVGLRLQQARGIRSARARSWACRPVRRRNRWTNGSPRCQSIPTTRRIAWRRWRRTRRQDAGVRGRISPARCRRRIPWWVRIHGLAIRDAQGKPYRMAGPISDIDARKRAEEAVEGERGSTRRCSTAPPTRSSCATRRAASSTSTRRSSR